MLVPRRDYCGLKWLGEEVTDVGDSCGRTWEGIKATRTWKQRRKREIEDETRVSTASHEGVTRSRFIQPP